MQRSGDLSLYLGLATAIATVSAAAVALGLLAPRSRREQILAVLIVGSAVLGIAAGLTVVAERQSSALLNGVIFTALLANGAYVVLRALTTIFTDRAPYVTARPRNTTMTHRGTVSYNVTSSTADSTAARPKPTYRWIVTVAAGLACSMIALFTLATPHLLRNIFAPTHHQDALVGPYPLGRPTFRCYADGRNCPGPGYASIDAYTNTPTYGDERNFVDAKLASTIGYGGWTNVLHVRRGDTVAVRVYVDNAGDASHEIRAGESVARQVRVHIAIPTGGRRALAVVGFISAANTFPRTINGGVTLYGDEPFHLHFLPGSGVLVNNWYRLGLRLPDALVTPPRRTLPHQPGILFGYKRLDGILPGDFSESGLITVGVRVL